MGSVGNPNPNPWAPYSNYKDCSQGICSIYCPQFCYLIFPPPPSDDDSGAPFSPLIIAIIGVLASALLLVSYYTIVARYCRRRNYHNNTSLEITDQNRDETAHDQWQIAPNGLDEALIKTIAVCKYQKSDGLIEGSECAVCLGEFQENESLRLLPKCSHAFHLPCIDTWLKSHSNCPLCRANVVVLTHPSIPLELSSQIPTGYNTNSYEIHRPNDLVLVVNHAQERCEQVVVGLGNDIGNAGDLETTGSDQESVEQFRRSISLGTFSCQRQLLVSDILKIEEIDEDLGVENVESWKNIGSSKGVNGEENKSSPVSLGMNRSISEGTFMFTVHDKGKNSSSPH